MTMLIHNANVDHDNDFMTTNDNDVDDDLMILMMTLI